MENQMEKKMEHEMETVLCRGNNPNRTHYDSIHNPYGTSIYIYIYTL